MDHLDTIQELLFKKVERFCSTQGITLKYEDLVKHINISSSEVLEVLSKPKPKPKPKKICIKPKKSSKKLILKPKKNPNNDYNIFITICDTHKLQYFQFHDEHNWVGPAINIKSSMLSEISLHFKSLKTTKITGINFYIIRPTSSLKDDNIVYPIFNSCKLEPYSLIGSNSDNDLTTDEEEIELEEWKHEATNTKYMIDPDTNIVYSFHTNEPVGKKIDEFTIDFNFN